MPTGPIQPDKQPRLGREDRPGAGGRVLRPGRSARGRDRKSGTNALIILTLAFTGLRFGELPALKVRGFDPNCKRLNVVESVTEVGGELVWTTLKTHQTRSVAVPSQLAAALEERWRGKQLTI